MAVASRWKSSSSTPAAQHPRPTWIGCVLTPDSMALNSVAAFTDGSLVATVLILPGKTFADAFAQRNTGAVLAWKPGDKMFQMLPGTELSANNGIETSPDDREFYVVSTTTKRVIAYSRDETRRRRFAPHSSRNLAPTTFAGLRTTA